jgi:signal transduction histidine kinase/YHS domain-containing protein
MHEALWLCALLLASLLTINLWLVARVLRPLRQLAQQANKVTEGDFTALEMPCGGIGEVEDLRRSLLAMVGHVRRVQEQGRLYAGALTSGQEAERTRIAHELHDETVQSLIGIAQRLDLASNWLTTKPDQAVQMLKDVRVQAVEAVDTLRGLIADLRPPALEELGLVSALKMLATKTDGVVTTVAVEGVERRLDENQELTLFRSAQETLKNVVRHSGASTAKINVSYDPNRVTLSVRDNGKGFRVPTSFEQFAADGHYGLVGIQERVQNLRGKLTISSTPAKGTDVQIELLSGEEGQPMDEVRDPVCSALIKPHQAYASTVYEGQTYYFCCPVCQGAFQQNPTLYLTKMSEGQR